jgi:hypothetical protein
VKLDTNNKIIELGIDERMALRNGITSDILTTNEGDSIFNSTVGKISVGGLTIQNCKNYCESSTADGDEYKACLRDCRRANGWGIATLVVIAIAIALAPEALIFIL